MKCNQIEAIKMFWDERSKLKETAGSDDFLLKELEILTFKKYLQLFPDVFLFCTISASINGRPPMDGNVPGFGNLFNMGVQLIGQDAHHAV
jgi:hypothetical protein